MSGFAAIFGSQDEQLLRDMVSRIDHRGAGGSHIYRTGSAMVAQMKSTSDASAAAHDERYGTVIALDGEIYNRNAFRSKAAAKPASDADLLVRLYACYADDMLTKIDGAFAMAIAGDNGMLLARDPLGLKPLYYAQLGSALIAASEIKAFPAVSGITPLQAGHAMVAGSRPWQYTMPLPPQKVVRTTPISEAVISVRRRLDRAVAKRVPQGKRIGILLSGGLDSSIVAALVRRRVEGLHSFTAGMEGAPDLAAAGEVAEFLGTQHHEITYSLEDMKKALPEIIRFLESFDAPLVRSAIPTYFVSKTASEFVDLLFTGEGADELFCGYRYLNQFTEPARLRQEVQSMIAGLQSTTLQRTDRMMMAHGLETAVPFLDTDFLRYVLRLPLDYLRPFPGKPEKWMLRKAFAKVIPESILKREKMKFSEGAGSSEIMSGEAAATISEAQFKKNKEIEPGLVLRSKEELHYYRIWREVMGRHVSAKSVGRTCDSSAAA